MSPWNDLAVDTTGTQAETYTSSTRGYDGSTDRSEHEEAGNAPIEVCSCLGRHAGGDGVQSCVSERPKA